VALNLVVNNNHFNPSCMRHTGQCRTEGYIQGCLSMSSPVKIKNEEFFGF
jgi:hypothetical protein